MSWGLETLPQEYAAAKLLALAGQPDIDAIAAFEILGEFSPEQQQAIGQRAVAQGAAPTVVELYLQVLRGETIEVSSSIRTQRWWPYLLAGAVVLGIGGYAYARSKEGSHG